MTGSITDAIPFILIGLVLLVVAVWLILRLNQSTTVVGDEAAPKDVLDEGAAPAARNQALIDAAPAAVPNTPAPAPTPVPVAEPAPEPPAVEGAPKPVPTVAPSDDLRQIKGVGPKLVNMLHEQGVTSFAQIAAWTESDIAEIDPKLGRFSGRIERDQWVEQAKLLISADTSAFSEKFGNNS
ncbi:MAG: helix-hairpin-helix domain-containing protein [Pseudomonadota bacterium]